jgi:uncharacterized ParB-like nuclease family protein
MPLHKAKGNSPETDQGQKAHTLQATNIISTFNVHTPHFFSFGDKSHLQSVDRLQKSLLLAAHTKTRQAPCTTISFQPQGSLA